MLARPVVGISVGCIALCLVLLAVLEPTVADLKDLGVPSIVGAIVGALIAHFAARARSKEEHQRSLEMLTLQDERGEAREALDATRELRTAVNADQAVSFGLLHNDWQDGIYPRARRIRSDDLKERVLALSTVLTTGLLTQDGHAAPYVVVVAAEDVETWLEAFIRREMPAPPARLPHGEHLFAMTRVGNRITLDNVRDHLIGVDGDARPDA
jgi:hypothetical protein